MTCRVRPSSSSHFVSSIALCEWRFANSSFLFANRYPRNRWDRCISTPIAVHVDHSGGGKGQGFRKRYIYSQAALQFIADCLTHATKQQ